jgi:putative addiction module component (TIGR02574 family)
MSHAAAKLPDPAEALYEEAMDLPRSERRALAERLMNSLDESPDGDVERAWMDEAGRRLDDVRAGRSTPVPWAEARARVFARE